MNTHSQMSSNESNESNKSNESNSHASIIVQEGVAQVQMFFYVQIESFDLEFRNQQDVK